MLKKTIKYKNLFTDEEVTEDFFFHLSKAELVELEMSRPGGLSEHLQRIIKAEDNNTLIQEFKEIILLAYGVRSEDGRRFIKNQRVRDEFVATEAYSELFMELATDTDAAVEFINGIIPSGMSEEAAKAAGIDPQKTPIVVVEDQEKPEPQIITRVELQSMSKEEFDGLSDRIASGEVKLED